MTTMILNDTIPKMVSSDYRERFQAEYYQLKIRYEKLCKMLDDWDNKKCMQFVPVCPRSLYDIQVRAMKEYLTILETRATIEQISIEDISQNADKYNFLNTPYRCFDSNESKTSPEVIKRV